MAIKINIPLQTKTGLEIPSESVILYDTIFAAGTTRMQNVYSLYKSVEDYQSGKAPIRDTPINLNMANLQNFTKQDFLQLDLIKVESAVQSAIESQIGVGTTTIVDLLPND
jgi:hypothetical protein